MLASVCFGVGGGICMPALMALAAQKGARSDAMASVMALMTVAHSLGMLVGALLGGAMMDAFELRWVFPSGAVVMVLGIGQFVAVSSAAGAIASVSTSERPVLSIDAHAARR